MEAKLRTGASITVSPYQKDGRAIQPVGLEQVEAALRAASEHLLARQTPDGYWAGELASDASVPVGYIPLNIFMTGSIDPQRLRKIINVARSTQNPDGSWPSHYGGPGDLNVSIQVYFGLKLGGVEAETDFMQAARAFILSQGGVEQATVFTKIWLALFGQYEWDKTPSVPPEIIFLPNWFYFNIYEFASWSRETLMALSIVTTTRPVCRIDPARGVSELFAPPGAAAPSSAGKPADRSLFGRFWGGFFRLADRLLKVYAHSPLKPGRRRALRIAEEWIVEHQERDGSWGGILLPWIYSLYGLKSLGYTLDHPVVQRGMAGFEDFILEDDETLSFQPATSPVWDTAWSLLALREAGLEAALPALQRAAVWLLGQEIRHPGDWRVKNPHTEPGGWAFEFVNDWYPDLDDSAVVPRALLSASPAGSPDAGAGVPGAVLRSAEWVLSMQSKDGGWGAFDRDNDRQELVFVPFADFLTPLDPTCADVTAHVLEFFGALRGQSSNSELTQRLSQSMQRGVAYLKRTQEPDGAWYGRWGVNYLYGTGLSLAGLAAAGEDMRQPYIRRAVEWLVSVQNPDGGWGETCQTYSDPTLRGQGASTASQTAWALIGLVAAGEAPGPAAQRGAAFLINCQRRDGGWDEPAFTGTGFPRVFYLRYDYYHLYFPIIALARFYQALFPTGS